MPTLMENSDLVEWARSVLSVAEQLATELAANERESRDIPPPCVVRGGTQYDRIRGNDRD